MLSEHKYHLMPHNMQICRDVAVKFNSNPRSGCQQTHFVISLQMARDTSRTDDIVDETLENLQQYLRHAKCFQVFGDFIRCLVNRLLRQASQHFLQALQKSFHCVRSHIVYAYLG